MLLACCNPSRNRSGWPPANETRPAETSLLLLVPAAGGMILDMDGQEITLLTPASRLYQSLLGKRAGDFIDEFELLVIEVS
jgi:hypothetical protein